jgi:23S rRNA pseudouridine1911/1915/1917 synthase
VRAPIDGREATSHVEVKARLERSTHLSVTLETGRTHQIRRHLLGRGYPVLGDPRYGQRSPFDPPRMALHARILELDHPVTGERLAFEQELPQELLAWRG